MGCRLWDRTELDTTEATQQQQQDIEYSSLCYTVRCLSILYGGWEFGLVASLFFHPEIPQAVPSGVTTV